MDEIFAVSQGQRCIPKYQIFVNHNSSYIIPFEVIAISTHGSEKRVMYWNSSTYTRELHPPTHPLQDKAPVLNLGIKLTFQFMGFQALKSTWEQTGQ